MEALTTKELENVTGGRWIYTGGKWIWISDDPEEPDNPFES